MASVGHPTQTAVGSAEVVGLKPSKNQSTVEVTDRQLKEISKCGGKEQGLPAAAGRGNSALE